MNESEKLIKEIQEAEITWIATNADASLFEAVFHGEHFQLSLNDFPDEPMFTLFFQDKNVDVEESPKGWHLHHNS